MLEDMKVNVIFAGAKYNLFLKYCAAHEINTIGDLAGFDFSVLLNEKGVSPKKVETYLERYNEVVKNPENYIETPLLEINGELLQVDIEILNALVDGVNFKILKKHKILTIGNLKDKTESELLSVIPKKYLSKLVEAKEYLKMNSLELFKTVMGKLKDTNMYTMALFRAMGYTLQEVADMQGLTRERVRQIVDSFYGITQEAVNDISKRFTVTKDYVEAAEVLSCFEDDEDTAMLLLAAFNNYKDKWEYLPFAEVFVPVFKGAESAYQKIYRLVSDFTGDGFFISEKREDFDEYMAKNNMPYMNTDALKKFAIHSDFRLYGDFFTNTSLPPSRLCSLLIAKEFPNGIKLYDKGAEDLARLRLRAGEVFGDIKLADENRALSVALARELVLWDRGLYKAASCISIDIALLEKIKKYVDDMPIKEIPFFEIFEIFKEELLKEGTINNRFALQGALQMAFPGSFKSSKDCLIKTDDFGFSYGIEDRVLDLLLSKNRPVSRDEIKADIPGLPEITLASMVANNNKIIYWKNHHFIHIVCLDISEKEYELFRTGIGNLIDSRQGIITARQIYKWTEKNINDFLVKNCIENEIPLLDICRYICGEENYVYSRPFMARRGVIDTLDIYHVMDFYTEKSERISYRTIKQTATDLGIPDGSFFSYWYGMTERYVRISDDEYLPAEKFSIPSDTAKEINKTVLGSMNEFYMPLIGYDNWEGLPDIGLPWNVQLLKNVLKKYAEGFSIVEGDWKDRRYETGIVVQNQSGIDNYPDLVAYLLFENNIKSISAGRLLQFLRQRNLIYKTIPQELYQAAKISYVEKDDNFVVRC